MRLFFGLLIASLLLELSLYGVGQAFNLYNSYAFFPIFPAIWLAMAIGGVHSAGFLSIIAGMVITAFVYALVVWSVIRLWSMLRRKSGRR